MPGPLVMPHGAKQELSARSAGVGKRLVRREVSEDEDEALDGTD